MLRIDKSFIRQIQKATTAKDLYETLQLAIQLEHATIPPYLTAMFSLKPGTNTYVRQVLHSIVIEEMLHMTIVGNILNALGGSPVMNTKEFIPKYPGPLPMGIGGQLEVSLTKYSKDQVKNVFMEIEEPEIPLVLPEIKKAALHDETFHTIGEFYSSIAEKISTLPFTNMPGDPKKQVMSTFFKPGELFPIYTKEDALRAIPIIVEQGEGTKTLPADLKGNIAHYYKFEELYKGKKIIKDSQSPVGYSFSNEEIPFNEKDVFNIFPDTKINMLPQESEERRVAHQFSFVYSTLLNGLHRAFNGEPDFLAHTMGLMYDIKLLAEKLCAMEFPGKAGFTIGPPFEYVDSLE